MFPGGYSSIVMRFSALLLAAILCSPGAHLRAQESPAATDRQTALDDLLSERDSLKAFDETVTAARKSAVSEQAILEARFLFHVDREEDAAIAALLPAFLEQNKNFKLENSAIFSLKDDWLAVLEYVQAIDALVKNDHVGFKKHITEAFWLSPGQASAFAPHIERLRLAEAMRLVKIDLNAQFLTLFSNKPIALNSLLVGKKATLLHFWAPASPDGEASLPDFVTTAKALLSKDIAVVSLLTDDSPQNLTTAKKLLEPFGPTPPGTWLIDSAQSPLSRELRLQGYPLFTLVSNDGSILFNGQPSDDQFWLALQKIDPKISRPAAPIEVK